PGLFPAADAGRVRFQPYRPAGTFDKNSHYFPGRCRPPCIHRCDYIDEGSAASGPAGPAAPDPGGFECCTGKDRNRRHYIHSSATLGGYLFLIRIGEWLIRELPYVRQSETV